MKHIKFYIALVTFILSFQLNGQEVMTLQKAISIGLENNYGIKISEKYIEIADNNNTWAKAGKMPTIALVGTLNSSLTEDQNPASFLQGTFFNGSLNLGFDVNWALYNGGRVKLNKEQFDLASNQRLLENKIEIQNLLRLIYQQYYDIIFQKEQFDVLQRSKEVSEDKLKFEEARKEFGASNSFNIVQFESAVLSDSTALINQKQNIELAERTLLNTLNLSGFEKFKYDEKLSTQIEELEVDKLKSELKQENFTLKSIELLKSVNSLNTRIQQSFKKPTVNFNGGINAAQNGFNFFADNPQTGQPFGFQDSRRYNASVNLSLRYNLFDGGALRTDVQSAKIQEEIDALTYMEAQAELNNQLDILINNYSRQVEVLKLWDEQIQLAQLNMDITETRFKAGQVTSIDFRNIQTQYLNTAFGKVGAIYNLIIIKSEIDYLVGRSNL